MATDIFITPTSGTVDFNNGVFGSVLGTIATMKVYDSLTSGNLSIQNSATSNLSGVKFLNRGNPGNVFEAYGTYGNLFPRQYAQYIFHIFHRISGNDVTESYILLHHLRH